MFDICGSLITVHIPRKYDVAPSVLVEQALALRGNPPIQPASFLWIGPYRQLRAVYKILQIKAPAVFLRCVFIAAVFPTWWYKLFRRFNFLLPIKFVSWREVLNGTY